MATNKKFVAKNGLDNNSQLIINLLDPVSSTDGANKNYVDTGLALKAPLASPTFTGTVTASLMVIDRTANAILTFNTTGANNKYLIFNTSSSGRWAVGVDGTAESGSNAGSDIFFQRYSDTASSLGYALRISRATGLTTLEQLQVNGQISISSAPSLAWNSSFSQLQIGSVSAIANNGGTTNSTNIINNCYYDNASVWKYIQNGYASWYGQYNGTHVFQSYATGTAGASATGGTTVLSMTAGGIVNVPGVFSVGNNPYAPATDFISIVRNQNAQVRCFIDNQNQGTSASSDLWLSSYGGGWNISCGSYAKNLNAISFYANTYERLKITQAGYITTSGSIGLGGLASTGASMYSIDLVLAGHGLAQNGPNQVFLTSNVYFNGSTWVRNATNASSLYTCGDANGNHTWYYGAAGAAGGNVSLVSLMQLTTGGGLTVTSLSTSSTITCASAMYTGYNGSVGSGTYYFGNGSKYITCNGNDFIIGPLGSVIAYNDGFGTTYGAFNAYSSTGGATSATISFYRQAGFATHFGLNTSNQFEWGGWSMGRARMTLDSSGNVVAAGNISAYSDARLKTNIMTISNALETTKLLRGVEFDRLDTGNHEIGVIAQEIRKILPEVVNIGKDENQTLSVDYGKITGLLIEAIKELSAKVDKLSAV